MAHILSAKHNCKEFPALASTRKARSILHVGCLPKCNAVKALHHMISQDHSNAS
ncbi:hypothetical protein Peur_059777 [Populus x canadensis]